MSSKFVVLFALIATAAAIPVVYKQPLLIKAAEPADAPAHYEFSYSVRDDHTGDVKSQQESRKGDDVKGVYTLIDADGYLRTVEYTADEHNGFIATVHREPIKGHQPAKIIAAPIHAAPIAVIPKIAIVPKKISVVPHDHQASVKISAHGIETIY